MSTDLFVGAAVSAAFGIAVAAGTGVFGFHARLQALESIVPKLDQLVTLLLQERINKNG